MHSHSQPYNYPKQWCATEQGSAWHLGYASHTWCQSAISEFYLPGLPERPQGPLLLSAKDSPPQWGMHALSKPQVGTTTRLHSFGREINLFVPVIKHKETKTWEKVRKSRRILSVGKHNKCQVVPAWSWYTCALYSVLPHVTTSSKAAKWEIMVAIKHYSHTHSVTPDVS